MKIFFLCMTIFPAYVITPPTLVGHLPNCKFCLLPVLSMKGLLPVFQPKINWCVIIIIFSSHPESTLESVG